MGVRNLEVFAYRNLHNGLFSLRDTSSGRVVAHGGEVVLRDAVFKVSEAGRQRVIRERSRNVHAGVEGMLVFDPSEMPRPGDWPAREARYNPYEGPGFVLRATGEPVSVARVVHLKGGKVYVP